MYALGDVTPTCASAIVTVLVVPEHQRSARSWNKGAWPMGLDKKTFSVFNRGWLALAALLAGCPGYLDESTWARDGGLPQVVAPPITGSGGQVATGGATGAGGAGGSVAPGTGGRNVPGTGGRTAAGTGGANGDGGVKPDAIRVDATPPPASIPLCSTAAEIGKLFVQKCGACHGASMPAAGLDLVSAGSKNRLVNVTSKLCAGKTLIVPGAEVTGHFFDKLAGAIPGCGLQMPFGGIAPMTAAEIKCVKDWITPPAVTQ